MVGEKMKCFMKRRRCYFAEKEVLEGNGQDEQEIQEMEIELKKNDFKKVIKKSLNTDCKIFK